MKNKNIVIAPCGNSSKLFLTDWLKNKEIKEFDLCLLFYHQNINDPELYNEVEYFYHLKDFKFRMIHKLLTEINLDLLHNYEYFYFIDDDIAIDTVGINKMFAISRTFDTSISQASLSQDSNCSWVILKNRPGCVLRYLRQIEVMAPLFNKEALLKCLPTFNENKSSWGFDAVWPKILNYPKNKIAVIDSVIMKHTVPVGGGELYKKIQVDPNEERLDIIKKYNASVENFYEYGRLQIINANQSPVYFYINSIEDKINKIKKKMTFTKLFSFVRRKLNVNYA
jgi:hypothetical protein